MTAWTRELNSCLGILEREVFWVIHQRKYIPASASLVTSVWGFHRNVNPSCQYLIDANDRTVENRVIQKRLQSVVQHLCSSWVYMAQVRILPWGDIPVFGLNHLAQNDIWTMWVAAMQCHINLTWQFLVVTLLKVCLILLRWMLEADQMVTETDRGQASKTPT